MTSETPNPPGLDGRPQEAAPGVGSLPNNGWKAELCEELAAELAPDSILDLSKILVPEKPDEPKLPLDETFIVNSASWEDCEARVAEHHRHRFRFWFGGAAEQMIQSRDLLNRYLKSLARKTASLSGRLEGLDDLIRHRQEEESRTPWTSVDLAAASLLILFSVVLLGMGINTLATYLMDSGFVIFIESPALAYLLSAVNVGLSGLLKIGFSSCLTGDSRRVYFKRLWVSGLLSGLVWLVTFSIIFPNIGSEAIDDILTQIENESASREALLEGIFVCSQLISEICIAAVMWIHLERLTSEHAPLLIMGKNPEHRAYLRELSEWNERARAATGKRASLEGRLTELRSCEAIYVARATAELRRRRNLQLAQDYGLEH